MSSGQPPSSPQIERQKSTVLNEDGSVELAVIILTYNEAEHVEACIQSVKWADRIIVFDSYSDDATLELAQKAGAEIGQESFQNFAQQRNLALKYVETDWVFFVDADERGTPELGIEIRQMMAGRPESGWFVPRHNYIFGRLTLSAGWFPDYQLRLFRHGRVYYERPVHEIAVVDGDIGYLKNPLTHYNYRDPEHFHATQGAYTDFDAQILKDNGVYPKLYSPYSQSIRQFWWRFATLGGYREGVHGLRLSAYMAYYEWVKYRKLKELWRKNRG
jgi:(heptosyl)LPS beta-1,4-glucosyltransferase